MTAETPLNDYRWFTVLAETENVSKTAKTLYITQPTLSKMLARLERSVGVPLFDRCGRRIVLNSNGVILYRALRSAQTEIDGALAAIRQETSVVRLGFLHSLGTSLVPSLAGAYGQRSPDVVINLSQGAADELASEVVAGNLDLAIIAPEPHDQRLRWHRLLVQDVVLVVPTAWWKTRAGEQSQPPIPTPSLRFADLAGETFVVMRKSYGMRAIFDDACERSGICPAISFEATDLATVLGLVAAQLGIALLPTGSVSPTADVVAIPLQDGLSREVGIVCGDKPSGPASDFLDFCMQQRGSLAGSAQI